MAVVGYSAYLVWIGGGRFEFRLLDVILAPLYIIVQECIVTVFKNLNRHDTTPSHRFRIYLAIFLLGSGFIIKGMVIGISPAMSRHCGFLLFL